MKPILSYEVLVVKMRALALSPEVREAGLRWLEEAKPSLFPDGQLEPPIEAFLEDLAEVLSEEYSKIPGYDGSDEHTIINLHELASRYPDTSDREHRTSSATGLRGAPALPPKTAPPPKIDKRTNLLKLFEINQCVDISHAKATLRKTYRRFLLKYHPDKVLREDSVFKEKAQVFTKALIIAFKEVQNNINDPAWVHKQQGKGAGDAPYGAAGYGTGYGGTGTGYGAAGGTGTGYGAAGGTGTGYGAAGGTGTGYGAAGGAGAGYGAAGAGFGDPKEKARRRAEDRRHAEDWAAWDKKQHERYAPSPPRTGAAGAAGTTPAPTRGPTLNSYVKERFAATQEDVSKQLAGATPETLRDALLPRAFDELRGLLDQVSDKRLEGFREAIQKIVGCIRRATKSENRDVFDIMKRIMSGGVPPVVETVPEISQAPGDKKLGDDVVKIIRSLLLILHIFKVLVYSHAERYQRLASGTGGTLELLRTLGRSIKRDEAKRKGTTVRPGATSLDRGKAAFIKAMGRFYPQ